MMTREARIVLTASRTALDTNAAGELRSLLAAPIAWPALLALAIPHGVLPLIFGNLNALAPDLTPPSLLTQLGSYAERMRLRNESASAELAAILETLGTWESKLFPSKVQYYNRQFTGAFLSRNSPTWI